MSTEPSPGASEKVFDPETDTVECWVARYRVDSNAAGVELRVHDSINGKRLAALLGLAGGFQHPSYALEIRLIKKGD